MAAPPTKRRITAKINAKQPRRSRQQQQQQQQRNLDETDAKARKGLANLKQHMEEWKTNDYIPDSVLDEIDTSTMMLAGELMQSDAERFDKLNEWDASAPGQTAADAEGFAYDVPFPDGKKPVSWDHFIEKKKAEVDPHPPRTTAGSAEDDEYFDPRPAPRPLQPDEDRGYGDLSSYYRNKTNIIMIDDPDNLGKSEPMGRMVPKRPAPEFMAIRMLDGNHSKFLKNPTTALSDPSVRNLESYLNRYVLGSATKVFSETEISKTFCDQMQKYVVHRYSIERTRESMIYTFFVRRPLYVYCIFGRDVVGLDRSSKTEDRRYRFSGYIFADGTDPEDEESLIPTRAPRDTNSGPFPFSTTPSDIPGGGWSS